MGLKQLCWTLVFAQIAKTTNASFWDGKVETNDSESESHQQLPATVNVEYGVDMVSLKNTCLKFSI
jgi:hypothetical protein